MVREFWKSIKKVHIYYKAVNESSTKQPYFWYKEKKYVPSDLYGITLV